jgi:hypothetical protein
MTPSADDLTKLGADRPPFPWSAANEAAAWDVAEDALTDAEISAKADVTRQTLCNWKSHPDFAARVEGHRSAIREAVRSRGIAIKENRVAALEDRWRRLRRVIEQRAASPQFAEVPGGSTGLISRDQKGLGKGEDFEIVDVYRVDTGLLKELREHEKQAAQELGQWADKHEISGPDGGAIPVSIFDEALRKVYGVRGDPVEPGGA